ncbi:MAG TPA: transferase [Syntrophomonas sp.]|nr:transferase [Syntrophomonas sp.]
MAVRAMKIATYLGKDLYGVDRGVIKPCSLNNYCEGGLVFLKKYNESMLSILSEQENITAIVTPEYHGKLSCSYVISDNPRLDFARVLQEFFAPNAVPGIAETARIGRNVLLGKDVIIGEYSVIGNDVVIGDGTEIRHHVVIGDGVNIGNECLLKSQCVVGEDGFGFERDNNDVPVRIPHIGSVEVGSYVEIGSCTTIMRGTLDNTVIKNYVKIDDHVVIGHNVYIEENCLLTACQVGGSTRVKKNAFLTTNATIRNGIVIGENVLVGIGSVVTKSTEDNVIIAGNPAKVIKTKD